MVHCLIMFVETRLRFNPAALSSSGQNLTTTECRRGPKMRGKPRLVQHDDRNAVILEPFQRSPSFQVGGKEAKSLRGEES